MIYMGVGLDLLSGRVETRQARRLAQQEKGGVRYGVWVAGGGEGGCSRVEGTETTMLGDNNGIASFSGTPRHPRPQCFWLSRC